MADRKPLKVLPDGGGDSTGLSEFRTGDTIGVANGGTGLSTVAASNILTGNGASALSAEANLTFDGLDLAIGNAAPSSYMDSVHGLIVGDTSDATSEITIATTTSGVGELNFTDTADTTNQGSVKYNHSDGSLAFSTSGGYERARFIGGQFLVHDTTNANAAQGFTFNQGTNDDEIIGLKSSDVAHGMTDLAETDTYGTLKKNSATTGGIEIAGYSEATRVIVLQAMAASADTTKTTGANAPNFFLSSMRNGATRQNIGADGNLACISNNGYVRFIFDAEGSSHQDVGTAWINFDDHDDVQLTRSLGIALDPASIIQTRWDDWGKDHFKEMEDFGLIGKVSDEGKAKGECGLVNMTLLAKLHNGAIGQLGAALNDMKEVYQERIAALESRLMRLEN